MRGWVHAADTHRALLTHPTPQPRPKRQRQSLRQEYEDFILQRIDEYKDQLSRNQLLSIADEAVRELEANSEEQLVLTEVLVLEHVDKLIMRRLRLPSFRHWRKRYLNLRRAQQQPTHWGIDAGTPLLGLVQRLEGEELALVVGCAAAPAAFFLAAHDASVLLIDQDLACVEAAETRAAAEALASRFQALVVSFAGWFPDVSPALVILDPALMNALNTATRGKTVEALKHMTVGGGVHCILPTESRSGVIPLGPEALQAHYSGWITDRSRLTPGSRCFVARKPPIETRATP